MKKLTKTMCVVGICALLSAGPAMAQTDEIKGSGTTASNSNDNSGKWGLLGLAGLLGLLGLKRRDDDKHRNTSVNR